MAGVEFYQRTVFLVLCQVVCLILAIFTPQTVDLEKMMDRVVPELDLKYDYLLRSTVFIYLVQFLGWSTYMFDSYVRQAIEKSYHSGEACLLVVPRSFKCQVGRITHVLQQWVDSEAFIREAIILTKVTVTAKGKGIAQYGSPEFCLFQRIQRGDDVNAEDYKEEEAVKYALQNKWIRRVTRYGVSELKLGNKAPQKDEVKEIICQLLENKSLSNAGKSKKKIPQGWIAELTKRNIVKLEVSASGDLSEFRHGYSVEFKL
uniref:Spt5-NGN domain-containing protein n=1 Tax=Caenorhabditis tropicalis TaxID=1561998 RepID=A0A1I7TMS4_9PELO